MDLNNRLFKNWVISAYGFHFVKFGLDDFLSNELVVHHRRLQELVRLRCPNAISTRCTLCSLDNLFPNHGGGGKCNHKYKIDCIERRKSKKGRRLCPNNMCGYFYHLIVNDHIENTPRWTCTDMSSWFVNWFEYAKCFLGNSTNAKSLNELDCTGVLSIIIHNRYMLNKVDNVDAFKKCRDYRNIIFHTANYEISDQDCTKYIDTMIEVMGDKKCLKENDKAKRMVSQLEQLRKEPISIIKGDIIDINELIEESQRAVDAIVSQRIQAKNEIKQLVKQVNEVKDNAVSAINDAINTIVEKHAQLSNVIMASMESMDLKKKDFSTPQDFQIDTSFDGHHGEDDTKAADILLQTMQATQLRKQTSTQIEKTIQELVDKFEQLNAVITNSEQHQKIVRTTLRCSTLADMLSCIQYLNSEECMTLLEQTARAISIKIGQNVYMKTQAVEASVTKAIDAAVPTKVEDDKESDKNDEEETVIRNVDNTILQKKLRDIYPNICTKIPQLFKYEADEVSVKLWYLQNHEALLEKVSSLSFHSLFNDDNLTKRILFSRRKLMETPFSFSNDEVDLMLKLGIFSDQVQGLKFTHDAFLELFASTLVLTLDTSEYSHLFTKLTLDKVGQFETFFRFFATIATERQIENLFDQMNQTVSALLSSCVINTIFHGSPYRIVNIVSDLQYVALACIQESSTVSRKVDLKLEHFVFDGPPSNKSVASLTHAKYIYCRTGEYHDVMDHITGLQCLHVLYSYGIAFDTQFTKCMLRNKASLQTICIIGWDRLIKIELPLRCLQYLTSLYLSDIKLEHDTYQLLLTDLSNNVLLQNLKLIQIRCISHTEDTSGSVKTLRHITSSKLTSLCIDGCTLAFSEVDTTNLEFLTLSPSSMNVFRTYADVFNCISSSNLVELSVHGIRGEESDTATTEALVSAVSTLSCLRSLTVRCLTFTDEIELGLHCGVPDVKIYCYVVNMSRKSFKSFIENIASIKSAVIVHLKYCDIFDGKKKMSDSEQFEYMSDVLDQHTVTITRQYNHCFVFQTNGNMNV